MVHTTQITVQQLKPAAERAQNAIALARKALNEMSWAASEGDPVEAAGHESEVSCQLSRLQGIIRELRPQ